MKFGLSFLPDINQEICSPCDYYQKILKLCQLADAGGLETIKMTEHYLHPYGGYCPDPLIFLSAVAQITRRIRLMTGCILATFHHPIQIAARTAQVDALSNGRLDVGLGRGYMPYEFQAMGFSMHESRERFIHTNAAIKTLWTKKEASYQCTYFNFDRVNSFPPVTQIPHPPLWGVAVQSRESFAWAGEQGMYLLTAPPLEDIKTLKDKITIYRESFNSHHPNKLCSIALSIPLILARETKIARELSELYFTRYLDVWRHAARFWQDTYSSAYPGYEYLYKTLTRISADSLCRNRQAFAGTTSDLIAYIGELQESFDIQQVLWQLDLGGQTPATAEATLNLFIDEVLPHFTEA